MRKQIWRRKKSIIGKRRGEARALSRKIQKPLSGEVEVYQTPLALEADGRTPSPARDFFLKLNLRAFGLRLRAAPPPRRADQFRTIFFIRLIGVVVGFLLRRHRSQVRFRPSSLSSAGGEQRRWRISGQAIRRVGGRTGKTEG